jgi:hypothetical protein
MKLPCKTHTSACLHRIWIFELCKPNSLRPFVRLNYLTRNSCSSPRITHLSVLIFKQWEITPQAEEESLEATLSDIFAHPVLLESRDGHPGSAACYPREGSKFMNVRGMDSNKPRVLPVYTWFAMAGRLSFDWRFRIVGAAL